MLNISAATRSFFLSCVGLSLSLIGQLTLALAGSSPPIVPELAGFGVSTPAGSGRHLTPALSKIFRVTNLNANGTGSLQDCIYASVPRTCVFEVSGTIDLTGDKSYDGSSMINLKHPYITIAGQTAPSPGITVKGKTLRIEAHDVLIQHLRFRVGDAVNSAIEPDRRDTILIAGNNRDPDRTPHNVVIDHCSLSWGVDEVVSVKDSSHHITLSNNIISEGLDHSIHPKGRHSKGLMAVGNYQTIYRNLFVGLRDRAPLDVGPNTVLVNNLSHNTKYANFWALSRSGEYASSKPQRNTSIVSNVRIRGADTSDRGKNVFGKASKNLANDAQFYVHDNWCANAQHELTACSIENTVSALTAKPTVGNDSMQILPASKLKDSVLSNVGARSSDRDLVDNRVVEQVRSNTGRVPNCVADQAIYFPVGTLLSATQLWTNIDLQGCYVGRFEGQLIEVSTRDGLRQRRTIVEHKCSALGINKISLNQAWSGAVDASSSYRIVNDCSNNAGGWPILSGTTRPLSLPAKPNQIMPSGYTRLEEYLHGFLDSVEGQN